MTVVELEAYGRAGVIAEQVISSIRTVLTYNGQEKEIQRFVLDYLFFINSRMFYFIFRYEGYLDNARKCGIKKSFINGIRMGVTYFVIFSINALGILLNDH